MEMDFLKYYNNELYYLREAAEKFAEENPQIAQQLSLEGFTCADPYIERLLEGVAYLAARVHYELDSEFPKFTQTLINNIFPDYFLPCPSASVVNFAPDFSDDDIINGVKIQRGTILNTHYRGQNGTPCTFTTTQDVTLWPITVENASYSTENIYDYANMDGVINPRAVLSVDLKTERGLKFSNLSTDSLDFYLTGASMKVLMDLHEQIFTDLLMVVIEFEDDEKHKYRIRLVDIDTQVEPIGHKEEHALLPSNLRNYSGYRLLKEYFSFPKKFLFFRILKLQDAFKQINAEKIRISFVLRDSSVLLETSVSKKIFSLYSTPVINLFEKRLDRQVYSTTKTELLINADNVKLFDYEIIRLEKVEGFDSFNNKTINFRPFYKVSEYDKYSKGKNLYYSYRRKLIRDKKKVKAGCDTYLSILDLHSSFSDKLVTEIAISALCSNRMIPTGIQIGSSAKSDFSLNEHFPIKGAKFIEVLTAPNYSALKRASDWAIINHLKINYQSIINQNSEKNTEILKDLLKLYASNNSLRDRKQINGINSVKIKKDITTIESAHGISFGTGIMLDLVFEEESYSDSGFFILANLIHIVIKNSIAINTLLETKVMSNLRGEIKKWKSSLL
jgi:type VI secretion system protein ImpG